MAYTTVTKVRRDAGFTGNSNVSDSLISLMVQGAEADVNAKVSDVYSMPLPLFFENELVFTGTANADATLSVVVGSDTYSVSVTNGQTASQVADAFRLEVLDATDPSFVCDNLGSGAAVTILAKTSSVAASEVQATSDSDSGLSWATDALRQVGPPLIEMITRGKASGLLLMQEYGAEAQNTDKDGTALFDMYNSLLDDVQSKKLKVLDPSGSEIAVSSTQALDFFPTEASRTGDDPTANKFTTNGQF